ncbi:MAG: hypothetical protein M3326_01645 [Actinomycetota bacterium]|nr:hypothetical protein [Actinomycetota bacterium]
MAQEDRATQAKQLLAIFEQILNVHRAEFAPANRPVAPQPVVDEGAIRSKHEKEALAGLSVFKRSERAAAKQRAVEAAEREISREKARLGAERTQLQAQLDYAWERLCANDSDVVLATLEEAFEDNEAPAAAVGVNDDEVALVVLVPGSEVVPEQTPSTTRRAT